jgi:hypothetical protein
MNGTVDAAPAIVQGAEFRVGNAKSGLVGLQIFG